MSAVERAAACIEIAETVLARVPLDRGDRRQGFDPRDAYAASVATAFAQLAVAHLALDAEAT